MITGDGGGFIDSSDCGGSSGVSCSGTSPHPTGPEDSADCEVCNILINIELSGTLQF